MSAATCPWCARTNTLHAGPTAEDVPGPGDVSICWKCHQPAMWDDYGDLRLPAPDVLAAIEAHPQYKAALAAVIEATRPSEAVEMIRHGQAR